MKDVLSLPVLVLNRNYQPIRVTTARDGLMLLAVGRARALDSQYEPRDFGAWSEKKQDEDDVTIGTSRGPIAVPRVLLLYQYSRVPRTPLRLSRRNLLLRDNYECQYCHTRPVVSELNLDHVIPKSRGGKSSWENLVVSCRRCNLQKSNRTPKECGMELAKEPSRPSWSIVVQLIRRLRIDRESGFTAVPQWEPFLGGVILPSQA